MKRSIMGHVVEPPCSLTFQVDEVSTFHDALEGIHPTLLDMSVEKPTLTEKDLEFDFDHSQIRDPRATPGRVKRPRYEERELSEEFLSKFHIPKHRNKHTDPLYSFYDLHRCHRESPDGSPTYDSAGFQLDYEKVAKWMKPVAYNKKSMVNGMERHLKRVEEETKKIYNCFFIDGKASGGKKTPNLDIRC
nr:hypothetical protein FVER53263_08480 [Fusarium verticillioides]